jgi:hypothetical protein
MGQRGSCADDPDIPRRSLGIPAVYPYGTPCFLVLGNHPVVVSLPKISSTPLPRRNPQCSRAQCHKAKIGQNLRHGRFITTSAFPTPFSAETVSRRALSNTVSRS